MAEVLRSDLARRIAQTFANRIFMVLLGIASSVVIARALGPAGRGSYYFAFAVAGLVAQFGNFGLHSSNTYFISRDRSLLPTLTGNSLLLVGVIVVIISVVGIVLKVFVPGAIPIPVSLAILIVPAAGAMLAYLLLQNLVLGTGDVHHFNLIEVVQGVTGFVLLWLVILSGQTRPSIVYGVGIFATALGAAWSLRLVLRADKQPLRLSRAVYRATFRYGIKAYLAAFASYLVIRSDVVLINYLLNDTATGYYSVAVSLIDKVLILPIAIGTILFPRLTSMSSDEERWQLTRRIAQMTAVMMVAGGVVAAVLVGPAIRILFGEPYLPAVPSFYILLPGAILMSISTILMNYLASIGMPPITVIAPALATVTNVVLNLVLIPRWDIEGAAFSSTVAYGLILAFSISYIRVTRGNQSLD